MMAFQTLAGLTKEEVAEFEAVFPKLVDELTSDMEYSRMADSLSWLREVLEYTTPNGKQMRGIIVLMAYKDLVEESAGDTTCLAHSMSWIQEILQAGLLLADDMMDLSEFRRGKPCWYLVESKGYTAVNDAFLLEATVFQLLRKKFGSNPNYEKLVELFLDTLFKTFLGQNLDTRKPSDPLDLESYNLELFQKIAKYKTGFSSLHLPIASTMLMVGYSDPDLIKSVEQVTLKIGEYFQAENDTRDCFSGVSEVGKDGTDIETGKCSWLFVTAKKLCSEKELLRLYSNYGVHDKGKVAKVKELYVKLDLQKEFEEYKNGSRAQVAAMIDEIGEARVRSVLCNLVKMVYGS